MKYEKLPESLRESINFEELFNHRTEKRSKVLIYNKETKEHEEKVIFRGYECFLKVPNFDETIEKSYMFVNKSQDVPEAFTPFVKFAKELDSRYNQLVVNWYDPEDYIELHRDCTAKMVDKEAPILCINLNESDDIYNLRHLYLENIETRESSSVPLLNQHYYIIDNNTTHRHAVGKGVERRISLTFRMID